MRRFFLCLFLCLGVTLAVPLPAAPTAGQAGAVYERTYAIYRNGSEIGTRTFQATQQGTRLEAVNETRIAVDVAFITVYRREETLREIWQDGRLERFSSKGNDDGDAFEVEAVRQDDGQLKVRGDAGTYEAPEGTWPATYWHRAVAQAGTLIHVKRGRLQQVSTTRVGPETVDVNGASVAAVRYRMTGDERMDLWYDDSGLIARVVYFSRGGDEIEFRLKGVPAPPRGLTLPAVR